MWRHGVVRWGQGDAVPHTAAAASPRTGAPVLPATSPSNIYLYHSHNNVSLSLSMYQQVRTQMDADLSVFFFTFMHAPRVENMHSVTAPSLPPISLSHTHSVSVFLRVHARGQWAFHSPQHQIGHLLHHHLQTPNDGEELQCVCRIAPKRNFQCFPIMVVQWGYVWQSTVGLPLPQTPNRPPPPPPPPNDGEEWQCVCVE